MASAEGKWKDESRDRQVMASNANGAEGAEGKTEENNFRGEDPKDSSGEEAVLETSVSEGGAHRMSRAVLLRCLACGAAYSYVCSACVTLGPRTRTV
jgi:hypothetical protein